MATSHIEKVIVDQIHAAVTRLNGSQRGRQSLRQLHACLTEVWIGLDEGNQEAIRILMEAAWEAYPLTTLEAIEATFR